MPLPFLQPRTDLLTADGALNRVSGAGGRPVRVLLARELCVFERYAPGVIGAGAGLASARLHAAASAPFEHAGFRVRRAGDAFNIWWWDAELVSRALDAYAVARTPALAPETLAQPRGEGWRIVRQGSGFEAQLWSRGALSASAWRRQPFSAADWAAFTRIQRSPAHPAPVEPPDAQVLPLDPAAAFAGVSLSDLTPSQAAAAAAGVAAVAILAIAGFALGQGLRFSQRADLLEAQLLAQPPVAHGPESAEAGRLQAYQALYDRPQALETLGVALAVLKRNGVEPVGFSAGRDVVTIVMPYSAIRQTEVLAGQLMATGAYREVRPSARGGAGVVELQLVPRGAAATTAG